MTFVVTHVVLEECARLRSRLNRLRKWFADLFEKDKGQFDQGKRSHVPLFLYKEWQMDQWSTRSHVCGLSFISKTNGNEENQNACGNNLSRKAIALLKILDGGKTTKPSADSMFENAKIARDNLVLQNSTGWHVDSITVVGNDDHCTLEEQQILSIAIIIDGHTRRETPLPKVTSPDTVRLSNSRQSGILWKRERKSFT